MMNVETVLTSSSESDVGGSNKKRFSMNPPSFRKPQVASKRLSQDPPGVTVAQEAILELVPQDVSMDEQSLDHQSTQSTLTGPPTIAFVNQPTDDDWELEQLNRTNPTGNRTSQHSRKSNRQSNKQPSQAKDPRPPSRPQARGYDTDESSSLPEIPGNSEDASADIDEDDVLNFLHRTYTAPATDDSLLFSDHVDEDRPSKTLSLDEVVHQSSEPAVPSREDMQRMESKKSMDSTIDTSPNKRQRPRQKPKGVNEEEEVDSDLTPVMKSPKFSKASLQANKLNEKPTSEALKSPSFQSPVSKQNAVSTTSKETKAAPTLKSKRPTKPEKTNEATSRPNEVGSKPTKRSTRPPKKPKSAMSKRNAEPSKSKHAATQPETTKAATATPSKSNRSTRPEQAKAVAPSKNAKKKPSNNQKNRNMSPIINSPTSVLDDPNNTNPSNKAVAAAAAAAPKTSTIQRPSDPYLSDADSSFSSYKYFGKPRANDQKDRNALLGLDDASSSTSSFWLFGKKDPTFGMSPDEDEYSPSADQPPKLSGQNDRNALLGLDKESTTPSSSSSSLIIGSNKRRPTRIFGSRDEEDRHSQQIDELDFDDENDDEIDSSLAEVLARDHRNADREQEQQRGGNRPPSRGAGVAGNNARAPPPLQSFSQIPIHPDMTPEEWRIAQEQIQFLESELDKVSALCQELTEAVEKDKGEEGEDGERSNKPPDGDWTRAQEQVKYLEKELETVQELCTLLTSTATESTGAIEMLEGDKQRLEDLIKRLEMALAKSKNRAEKQEKALEDWVNENDSKCCNWCWDWISEPVVWFVSYLYRID